MTFYDSSSCVSKHLAEPPTTDEENTHFPGAGYGGGGWGQGVGRQNQAFLLQVPGWWKTLLSEVLFVNNICS